MEAIKKPAIIITSLGRTGTKFFYALFRRIISDGVVLHEPDVFNVIQYQGVSEKVKQVFKQIREAGAYNMLLWKPLGKWSLIALSDDRVRGDLDYKSAIRQVLSLRKNLVSSRKPGVYVEANTGYYGVIDVLPDVYKHHRLAYIIRDGREWVRSWMNWGQAHGGMYGKGKIGRLLGHTWPTASELEGDLYSGKWQTMSRFERICWAWARLNKYALDTVQKNSSAKIFRFEDIFKSDDRYQHLADLVDFTTDMPGVEPVPYDALEGWLDRRIHKSSGEFPAWSEWSAQHKQQFLEICGPLMEELGYEFN